MFRNWATFGRLTVTVFASSLALTTQTPAAQDFYHGKTIEIIVGFSAGGGYDFYARALARYLPRHIPGNPSVIVQNQPGAGSLVAVRSLDADQPKDGTVMVTFEPGLITQSLIQPKTTNVNFSRFAFIGSVTPNFYACYGFGPNGVKSWEDFRSRKQFVLGSEGKGGGSYVAEVVLRDVFNAPIKQVLGYPGSAEQRLALERGELDGDCGVFSSVPKDWIRDGKVHPFVRFTQERPADMSEKAVFVNNEADTQEQRDLLNLLFANNELGRSFIMSGDVPADRIAIMRKAFDETMADPAFRAEMKAAQLPFEPLTGAAAEAIVAKGATAAPDILAKARTIYE